MRIKLTTLATTAAIAVAVPQFLQSVRVGSLAVLWGIGVATLLVALVLCWKFPKVQEPLAATAAVILCSRLPVPLVRWLRDQVQEPTLRYWLLTGPGDGVLGQLPGALLVLVVGRWVFGRSLQDLWGGGLRASRQVWLYGFAAALALTVVTVGLALAVGEGKVFWQFDLASFGVNMASNLWEEVRFRSLLLVTVREAFGDKVAYVWTGLLFGLSHGLGPKGFFLAVTTWVMAWAVVRARSLWGGWVAHQAGDLLIDSLLH